MLLYLVLVAVLGLCILIATNRRAQKVGCCLSVKQLGRQTYIYKLICDILSFAILFTLWFLSAFRSSSIGNDTRNYIGFFIDINRTGIGKQYRIEYGFQILCLIVGKFTKNPQTFLAVCATICYLGVGIYIFKYSKNILVSTILVFCFCFSIFVNTLRQDIAMVICLYAYQALKKNKKFLSFLLIAFAFTFHKSTVVFLPVLLYKVVRCNLKGVIIISLIIIVLSISGLIESLVRAVASQYSGYFDGKYAHSGWLAVSVEVLRNFVFFYFFWQAYGKIRKKDRTRALILFDFALLLFCSCFGFVVNLFTRLAQFFLIPAVVEIPNACYSGNIKRKNTWIVIICGILLLNFLVVLILRPEWNNLYPFSFFWS